MSNEIHSLKIGNSEYPIYSTGVKLGSATGSSFMVASASSGNVVLGVSNAISGDSTALTIQATSLLVGGRSTLIDLGTSATNVKVGNSAANVLIGDSARTVGIGTSATMVTIGTSTGNVGVGINATNVGVGSGATNINLGLNATTINMAVNDTEASLANKVLIGADPAVVDAGTTLKNDWLSKQALQTFIVGAKDLNIGKYASYIRLGNNASNVYLGNSASYVWVGSSATTVYLGSSTTSVYLGMSSTTVNVGNGATTVTLGNSATNINIASNSTNASLANKVLIGADPAVVDADTSLKADWLSKQALQTFIVGAKDLNIGKYASYVYLGNNASYVYLGNNASYVYLGRSTSGVYLGSSATTVELGTSASGVYIGNTAGTSEATRYIYIGHLNSTSTTYAYTVIQLNNKVMPRVISTTTPYIDLGASTNLGSRFRTGYFLNVNYATTCAQNSDERLKNFGDNLKIDFDALAQIRKANYTWKNPESYGAGNNIGVSAQEVQKLYPEVVVEDPETKLLSVDYAKLSVVALAAIDELHKENVELKSRLDAIETMVKQINNQ